MRSSLPEQELMRRWTVAEVVSFLHGRDLEGPAQAFFANGVAGEDFLTMSWETFTTDLRLSSFVAQKVLTARNAFLSDGA